MVKCYHSITLPPYFYHLITVFLIQITWCSFTHHVAESLFHHAPLLEQIVYRLMLEIVHRALAEEGQPRLDAAHACTQCQITENNQVERDGSSTARIIPVAGRSVRKRPRAVVRAASTLMPTAKATWWRTTVNRTGLTAC